MPKDSNELSECDDKEKKKKKGEVRMIRLSFELELRQDKTREKTASLPPG